MCSIKWSRTRRSLSSELLSPIFFMCFSNRNEAKRNEPNWTDRRWHKFWTCFWFIAKLGSAWLSSALLCLAQWGSSNLIKSNRCIELCIIRRQIRTASNERYKILWTWCALLSGRNPSYASMSVLSRQPHPTASCCCCSCCCSCIRRGISISARQPSINL